jgi:predicted outer membrane repeat protein
LRAIVANANNGDTVNFASNLRGTTITLTQGMIESSLNLTIDGQTNNITISDPDDGVFAQGVFAFTNPTGPVSETVNNLSISNSNSTRDTGGGALYAQCLSIPFNASWTKTRLSKRKGKTCEKT